MRNLVQAKVMDDSQNVDKIQWQFEMPSEQGDLRKKSPSSNSQSEHY